MREWFKVMVAVIVIANIAGIIALYMEWRATPVQLDERVIENRLDALLEAAKEDHKRRNQLAEHRNELTLQTLAVLARAATIALLDRADHIKKELFKPQPTQTKAVVAEPGPGGVIEEKLITTEVKAKSTEARTEILKQFVKIAAASFGPLDQEGIAVDISREGEVLYRGSFTLDEEGGFLSYEREILLPVGDSTLPLNLRMRIIKHESELPRVRDSRFSSWLKDGGVLYGIYWLDYNNRPKPLWHNEPADEVVAIAKNRLQPWPESYARKQVLLGDAAVSVWMKTLRHRGEKALALAAYSHPESKDGYIAAALALNIVILIGLVSLKAPTPLALAEAKRRKTPNLNTNISTLRSDNPRPISPMSQNKRSRNSDIVRRDFQAVGAPDVMQGSSSEVLRSILRKMRQ